MTQIFKSPKVFKISKASQTSETPRFFKTSKFSKTSKSSVASKFSKSFNLSHPALAPRSILPVSAKRRHGDRRYLYLASFIFAFAAIFTALSLSSQLKTEAASLADFDAGNIITDFNMSNYTSMTEAEIQAFLNSKNSCSRSANASIGEIRYETISEDGYNRRYYFYNSAGNVVSVMYHVENGYFVCLNNEKFDETTGAPSSTGVTAAHIIYTAAQTYKINPQVLLVLLQKEQGLITDDFPNSIQYRAATGYGCPDNGSCSTKYYGLVNQINNAAKLFRTVLDGGWTNYPLGVNYIQYNSNASCGGSDVEIKNLATSSLYRYTPYQPNSAALAAGYGTVNDGCAAYGNRNFYLYFSDWFGDPTDDSSAQPKGVTSSVSFTGVVANAVLYQSHLANIGWESTWASDGALSGTTGQSRRLEAIYIKSSDSTIHLSYQSHLANIGWESTWASDGALSGTTGQSRRLEAIKIKLDDASARLYDIYYRSHVQDIGWLAWTMNGEPSGSEGFGRRLEAIEIVIMKKGSAPTADGANSLYGFVKNS